MATRLSTSNNRKLILDRRGGHRRRCWGLWPGARLSAARAECGHGRRRRSAMFPARSATSDVTLGDTSVPQLMQTDAFEAMVHDRELPRAGARCELRGARAEPGGAVGARRERARIQGARANPEASRRSPSSAQQLSATTARGQCRRPQAVAAMALNADAFKALASQPQAFAGARAACAGVRAARQSRHALQAMLQNAAGVRAIRRQRSGVPAGRRQCRIEQRDGARPQAFQALAADAKAMRRSRNDAASSSRSRPTRRRSRRSSSQCEASRRRSTQGAAARWRQRAGVPGARKQRQLAQCGRQPGASGELGASAATRRAAAQALIGNAASVPGASPRSRQALAARGRSLRRPFAGARRPRRRVPGHAAERTGLRPICRQCGVPAAAANAVGEQRHGADAQGFRRRSPRDAKAMGALASDASFFQSLAANAKAFQPSRRNAQLPGGVQRAGAAARSAANAKAFEPLGSQCQCAALQRQAPRRR